MSCNISMEPLSQNADDSIGADDNHCITNEMDNHGDSYKDSTCNYSAIHNQDLNENSSNRTTMLYDSQGNIVTEQQNIALHHSSTQLCSFVNELRLEEELSSSHTQRLKLSPLFDHDYSEYQQHKR